MATVFQALRPRLLLLFVLLMFSVSGTEGQMVNSAIAKCPPHLNRAGNLVALNNKCYDVVTYEHLSWEDAQSNCKKNAGRLVEIEDVQTLAFLKEYMGTLDSLDTGVWIGLHDKGTEGTWHWASGRKVTLTHWASGEPGGVFGWIDDCAVMKKDGYWYDYQCDVFYSHWAYICQYDIPGK